MKMFFAVLVATTAFISIARAQTNDPATELHALTDRVIAKYSGGKTNEADYADDIKAFDAFIAKEKDIDPTNASLAVYMKARLYLELLHDYDKTKAVLQQLASDFPQTRYGQAASQQLLMFDQLADEEKAMAEAEKKQDELLGAGKPFPDFSENDLDGKPLSVTALKGKVVLVDFWATWCVLCHMELPNIITTYKKHHAEGFEIVGISLDDDRSALERFVKETDGMTWPEYFDGKHWQNKLAQKYLVSALPFNVLVGPDGKIIGTRLQGAALEAAVAAALAKK
ncbi:MAG TPA: redoxin family protein [Candidatus Sulfotelmatobacter sp.]|jgi:peroxiredoxin|nr:redoxin family protein [Candidatus Sulfotelmatobacter sp.]